MIEDVEVWSGETDPPRRVGVLRPSFQGPRTLAASSFEYDSDFLVDGWQISPDLPMQPGRMYTADNQTLPGAFSDAAPDEWGQKIIRADHASRSRHDGSRAGRLGEFDYLLGVSDNSRMGALRFRADGAWLSDEPGVANVHDLDRILEVAARYDADEATDDDIAYLNDVATSPGGARPKANVVMPDGTLAIAKLPHSKDGRFDVERWEAVALTIAADAGLHTPTWSLAPRTGRTVLLSRRFDRRHDGLRLGYVSARTAMELGAHDDGSRLTYEDFSDTIVEWSSASAEDLREMFGRIALTVLVNNVDDHWRNHGFLHTPDGWRLAPLFDVNPSRHRGVINSRAITRTDDPRDRDLRELLRVARAFRLDERAGTAALQRVAVAVAGWDRIAERFGVAEAEREAMRVAFSTRQLDWALEL